MSLAHAKLDMYERQVSDALRMGVDTHDDAEDDNPWASVLQAVFFAYTYTHPLLLRIHRVQYTHTFYPSSNCA
jgi:hypothetical protein